MNDIAQTPELLTIEFIQVMKKWSKECTVLFKYYPNPKDNYFDKFYHHDSPKQALIKIFDLFCTPKNRHNHRFGSIGNYHLGGCIDLDESKIHHIEKERDTVLVFFASKEGLPVHKFVLKFSKKRWYIDDLQYELFANEWISMGI